MPKLEYFVLDCRVVKSRYFDCWNVINDGNATVGSVHKRKDRRDWRGFVERRNQAVHTIHGTGMLKVAEEVCKRK